MNKMTTGEYLATLVVAVAAAYAVNGFYRAGKGIIAENRRKKAANKED
jgi:hypothetical protein